MEQFLSRRGLLAGGGALGLLAACSSGSTSTSASASGTPSPSGAAGPNPLVPFAPFAAPVFNDEALFALGAAAARTAEVGEVLMTAQAITQRTGNPQDPTKDSFTAYVEEFRRTGARLAELAASAAEEGFQQTANARYLRSSMYNAQALFFVLGGADPGKEEADFDRCDTAWQAALDSWDVGVERFEVTGAGRRIPCYFLSPAGNGRRPTVIISEGSDGQNVETMQFGVRAGLERGYNVVLFEGPGQMSLLFKKRIPFTAQWDEVVSPIVKEVRARDDVGSVAVVGISFGGMLCARVAARTPGVDAVVLQPGAYSFPALWGDQKDVDLVRSVQDAPEAEQRKAAEELNKGFQQAWPTLSPLSQFTIYKRGEIMSPTMLDDARAGRAPTDYYGVLKAMLPFDFTEDYRQIQIPTMVTSNEGDEFFAGQSKEAFDLLRLPDAKKQLLELTAAQGAQLHDQPMGPQVAQEYVFDWLAQWM